MYLGICVYVWHRYAFMSVGTKSVNMIRSCQTIRSLTFLLLWLNSLTNVNLAVTRCIDEQFWHTVHPGGEGMAAGAGVAVRNWSHLTKQETEKESGSGTKLWNLSTRFHWCTSPDKTLPPKGSITSPSTISLGGSFHAHEPEWHFTFGPPGQQEHVNLTTQLSWGTAPATLKTLPEIGAEYAEKLVNLETERAYQTCLLTLCPLWDLLPF